MTNIKLLLAGDYRGIEMRQEILPGLEALGYDVEDLGIVPGSPMDYVDISKILARRMNEVPGAFGLIICGTGQGVSIALNRYAHMRAIVARTTDDASQGREKLNANTLCIGCKNNTIPEVLAMIQAMTSQTFRHEKHGPCARKLDAVETAHAKAGVNLIVRGVIEHEGHLLLTTPSAHNKSFAQGLYFLPGGHVDHNEGARQALAREINEEMGLEVKESAFCGVLECSWDRKGQVYHEIDLVYRLSLEGLSLAHPPKPLDHGFHEFVWMPVERLGEITLLPETLKPLIQRALGGEGTQPYYSQMLTK